MLPVLPFLSLCRFNFLSKEYDTTSELLVVPSYGSRDLFFHIPENPYLAIGFQKSLLPFPPSVLEKPW